MHIGDTYICWASCEQASFLISNKLFETCKEWYKSSTCLMKALKCQPLALASPKGQSMNRSIAIYRATCAEAHMHTQVLLC